jgi:hypothetical protein
VRCGLWTAFFAALQAHRLLEGLWSRWDDRFVNVLPAVGVVVLVILEVRNAVRASKRQPQPPEALPESLS